MNIIADDSTMSNTEHYTITGVALSNETILILCTFGFATLGITLFLILRNQPNHDEEDERLDRHRDNYGDELDKADAATLNRAQRRARAKYKMKQARRDMAPVVQVAARAGDDDNDHNIAADGVRLDDDDVVVDNNIAEGNPNRRERQRLAKQMERKERKMYSLEAQRWREKNSVAKKSDMKSKTKKSIDDVGDMTTSTQNVCMIEDLFPQRLDNNDSLSDIIFWKAIISSIKSRQHDDTLSDELISQLQSRAMTIREFIERVEFDGSVSIIDLADEWDISIADALREIERLKELYNISGVVDSSGNYSIRKVQAAFRANNMLHVS